MWIQYHYWDGTSQHCYQKYSITTGKEPHSTVIRNTVLLLGRNFTALLSDNEVRQHFQCECCSHHHSCVIFLLPCHRNEPTDYWDYSTEITSNCEVFSITFFLFILYSRSSAWTSELRKKTQQHTTITTRVVVLCCGEYAQLQLPGPVYVSWVFPAVVSGPHQCGTLGSQSWHWLESSQSQLPVLSTHPPTYWDMAHWDMAHCGMVHWNCPAQRNR